MPRLELSAADVAEVHRFVARRVSNHADAADIAQQTLLLACAKSETFRGKNFSGWLFTIARHLIVDHYRTQNRFQFLAVEALVETEPALWTPRDAVRVVCECRALVSGWLDCLNQRLRLEEQVAVLMADIYGHRDEDSAAVLRMRLPSFKLLLHGARGRLHGVVGGRCTVVKTTDGAPATHRVAVICRLSGSELLALRDRLLEGVTP